MTGAVNRAELLVTSDVNKTLSQDQDQESGSQDQDLHIFSRPRLFGQDQDQDFTRTTEQVTMVTK